jgi:hypothetical protein
MDILHDKLNEDVMSIIYKKVHQDKYIEVTEHIKFFGNKECNYVFSAPASIIYQNIPEYLLDKLKVTMTLSENQNTRNWDRKNLVFKINYNFNHFSNSDSDTDSDSD